MQERIRVKKQRRQSDHRRFLEGLKESATTALADKRGDQSDLEDLLVKIDQALAIAESKESSQPPLTPYLGTVTVLVNPTYL